MSKLADALASFTVEDHRRVERIVRENRPLARWAVGKWGFMCKHMDGFEVEALMLEALWVAVVTWEPERGTLGTYAGNQMRWVAQRIAQKPARPNGLRGAPDWYQALSLDVETDEDIAYIELVADPADPIEQVESELDVQRILSGPLTDREREIIDMRMAGYTLEEVGQRYGVTRERIRQIALKAGGRLGLAA